LFKQLRIAIIVSLIKSCSVMITGEIRFTKGRLTYI